MLLPERDIHLFRIKIPKNSNGMYLDQFHNMEEYEVILPRNTKFIISGISKETRTISTRKGATDVTVDVIEVEVAE